MPGAFGYFNARTRYFDEVLLREAAQGIDQLVVLGVGFDSRSLRFAPQLGRNQGNAHRSGVANVQALLQPHGFGLREELDPAAMEERFLSHLPGGPRKVWGVVRMAHAARL